MYILYIVGNEGFLYTILIIPIKRKGALKMSEKLKIGVFGAYRGMTMIRALLHHPDAELVAVCDKYEPMLQKVQEKADEVGISVTLYKNFEDFLAHPTMDAVVLANYANEHAPFAIRCLKAGKHVLSEVLTCETMAQAVELIETVEETGLVYAYAENYCYMAHTFEMWKRYKTGEIGEVRYGEGEYIHDCSAIWPRITYGDRTHWRNRMHANFYCTHSLGPLIAITGLRPKQVVGFETRPEDCMIKLGDICGTGIEMVTMENGAVFKSIHGGLKREPSSVNYELYCSKGMMESGRFSNNEPNFNLEKQTKSFNIYKEGKRNCEGSWEQYDAESDIAADDRRASGLTSHAGSDFYPTHFFIERILDRPAGKEWSIDVYQAVDMCICGILAYHSVLNGNTPVAVPDLRDPKQRDAYRNDHACRTPEVAGDQLLPCTSHKDMIHDIPDETYEYVKQLWLKGERA